MYLIDGTELWPSLGCIEDSLFIDFITDKHPVNRLKEVSSALEPKQSKTCSLPQSKAYRLITNLLSYLCHSISH